VEADAMKQVFAIAGVVIIVGLAAFGLWKLIAGTLADSGKEAVVETTAPLLDRAASAAGEKIKQAIVETPDEKLEDGAETLSRKSYYITKGLIKGQLGAILDDVNKSDIDEKMVQVGKDVSEKMVRPLSKGLSEGSAKVLEDLDSSLTGVREFADKNRDLLEAISQGVQSLHESIEKSRNQPPTPQPGPPTPFGVPPAGPPPLPHPAN
jgi:hypothetical protein